ncbi:hypothetical protein B0T25DRAFT_543976 [Lasiosphaeria hispida]|uniref:RING-CH-type domain-containing protein n=1 Tax=Lasiosphaeria hispida TaxID=260671 RepID=A0AAJ0HIB1_9PEZI|nr:hypothetical protein B0T25DRAFT_543976 [Lasiosphaeria hispida]
MTSPASSRNTIYTPAHTIIPAPYATADTKHICFICLQTDTDAPNGPWVNPCPCSLEAHGKCMLQWVVEIEKQARAKRIKPDLRCPACRAVIHVDEPHDAIVALQNALYRRYRRISPTTLVLLLSSCTVIGSSWYGWGAFAAIAGPRAARRYIGLDTLFNTSRGLTLPKVAGVASHVTALALIGPGLVLFRVLPSISGFFVLPFSIFYGAILTGHTELWTWPPSPELVIATIPTVQLAYSYFYYEVFGPLERRFHRTIHGLPQRDENTPPGQDPTDEPGFLQSAIAFAGALRATLSDDAAVESNGAAEPMGDAEVEFEVQLGGNEHEAAEDEFGFEHDMAAERPAGAAQQEPEQLPQDENRHANRAGPPAPAPVPAPALAPNALDEDGYYHGGFSLTTAMSSITTALLYPFLASATGELLRLALPRAWVTRPRFRTPGGLLQSRWGRSFVGACLFTVFRDAFFLYIKYRRAQMKTDRQVRHIEKAARP